jgi:hypothetical protein
MVVSAAFVHGNSQRHKKYGGDLECVNETWSPFCELAIVNGVAIPSTFFVQFSLLVRTYM